MSRQQQARVILKQAWKCLDASSSTVPCPEGKGPLHGEGRSRQGPQGPMKQDYVWVIVAWIYKSQIQVRNRQVPGCTLTMPLPACMEGA